MKEFSEKVNLFLKSVFFSGRLLISSSGWMLVAYFICSLVTASLNIMNVYFMKIIIDILSGIEEGWQDLYAAIFIYAGVFLILFFINALSQIIYNSIREKAFMNFDVTILSKMKHIPMELLDSSSGKDFLMYARCANENAVYIFFNILNIITSLYTFFVAISIIAEFSLLFALILIFMVIPGIILNYIVKKRRYQYQFNSAYSNRKLSYYYSMLTGDWASKDIRVYNLSAPIKQRYEEERKSYEKGIKRLDINQFLFSVVSVLIEQGGVILFTVYLLYKSFYSQITVGDVTMYIGYSISMRAAFSGIISTIASGFQDAQLVMGSYFKLMEMECKSENLSISKRKLETFESLEFDNVYFKYPNTENYILQGASFRINKGDKLSISL